MRVNQLPVGVALILVTPTVAFAPPPRKVLPTFALEAQRTDYGKAIAGVFAGMTLASQVAYASYPPLPQLQDALPSIVQEQNVAASSSIALSAVGFNVGGSGASFSTMDFSMPSYDDATTTGTKSAEAPPAFNPFGSSSSTSNEDKSAEKAAAAEQKAAAEQAKADAKAAAEQAKADAKAAAEQAKAEKAARRAAEVQKQKEAVARASAKKDEAAPSESIPAFSVPETPAFKVPDVPEFKVPDMPELKVPDMPAFKVPDMPKMEAPKFNMPKMSSFDMPKFDAPKFDMPTKGDIPKFDMPKSPEIPAFKTPDMPKVDMPSFSMPDTSALNLPKFSLPKVDMPKMPEYNIDAGSAPSFPSFGGKSSSSSTSADGEFIEPQEVRDERAREGRQVYMQADKEAKAIEAQARAVRAIADEKRKVASALKDDACKTHWGGKFLCLRPFNSGY